MTSEGAWGTNGLRIVGRGSRVASRGSPGVEGNRELSLSENECENRRAMWAEKVLEKQDQMECQPTKC